MNQEKFLFYFKCKVTKSERLDLFYYPMSLTNHLRIHVLCCGHKNLTIVINIIVIIKKFKAKTLIFLFASSILSEQQVMAVHVSKLNQQLLLYLNY